MRYQLWDMVSYGHMDDSTPFTLLKESNNFIEIYKEFSKTIKTTPCVIIMEKTSINSNNRVIDSGKKIYESPDGGKTIYERSFMDYENVKKIK